jgi:EAL domain-containing protein (putative c-di-GMP-specific phosphodiesterase class I)/CheY-like chemotaxis protein
MDTDFSQNSKNKILLVEDEPNIQNSYGRVLRRAGFEVVAACDGVEALLHLEVARFEVILSDIWMPGIDGVSLLREIRLRDSDVPVVLMTANPSIQTATDAIHYGVLDYLIKPIEVKDLVSAVERAARVYRLAKIKREAMAYLASRSNVSQAQDLDVQFQQALSTFWMAYQPIVRWSERRIFSFEALLRPVSHFSHASAFVEAAEYLGRLHELGRMVRDRVAFEAREDTLFFVNLHSRDLFDEILFDPDAPLSKIASQVVLEITERASVEEIRDLPDRISRLRALGFRLAIDDLGAGYAGFTSFAQINPEIVKIDMSLIRNIDQDATKRKLVRSLIQLCQEMKVEVVCEGIETPAERDVVVSLGCDLLQGYLFAKPARPFTLATF